MIIFIDDEIERFSVAFRNCLSNIENKLRGICMMDTFQFFTFLPIEGASAVSKRFGFYLNSAKTNPYWLLKTD